MATQQPPHAMIQLQPSAPAPSVGNRFSVTVTATDFLIGIGHVRPIYAPDGKMIGQATEYGATYAVSPTAAVQLLTILQSSLKRYEEEFGRIPNDPDVLKRIAEHGDKKVRVSKGKVVPIKAGTAAKKGRAKR